MPATATRRRKSKPRGRLAQSPALRELADQFTQQHLQAERERERQRQRAEEILRAQAERDERARSYQERNRPRARQEQRVLDLLRRGAGVTQILRESTRSTGTLADVRRAALHLQQVLTAVAARDPKTACVNMSDRDLERTRRFLDALLDNARHGRAPDLASHPAWMS